MMPLFLVLNEGYDFSAALIKNIKKELRTKCSPRHVPNKFLTVQDIPYTLSGKKMEVPVKKLLIGRTKPENINRDAIRNPEAMDNFVELLEQGELKKSN